MVASIIGFYYVQAVRARLDQCILWTVPGRYFAAAFMAILVAFTRVGPGLLLFAAVDAAGATWTRLPFDPRSKSSSRRAVAEMGTGATFATGYSTAGVGIRSRPRLSDHLIQHPHSRIQIRMSDPVGAPWLAVEKAIHGPLDGRQSTTTTGGKAEVFLGRRASHPAMLHCIHRHLAPVQKAGEEGAIHEMKRP